MLKKEQASGRIVRVSNKEENQLGLFRCSAIAVGNGMAGEFLDNGEGDVVQLSKMIETVGEADAAAELETWRSAQDRAKIKEVVLSVDDAQKEFEGNISLRFGFEGSLRDEQSITRKEAERLLESMPEEKRKKVLEEFKGKKRLFSKEGFPEWDDLKAQRARWSQQVKDFGIPMFEGMTVMRIELIPEVEALFDKIEKEHTALVEALIEKYPKAIEKDTVDSDLYDESDYRPVGSLIFRPRRKWMHFGVPDVLKEIDMARWEAERKRTAEVWAEIKQNGIIILRKQVAEMVKRLVDTMKPVEDGGKKKFFATAITNLTDFFETFKNRNLAGDAELEAQVAKLKDLVSGKDVAEFKTDEQLRVIVKKEGAKIQESLEAMLVPSGARTITFSDV